jgi:hypothetical protein
MKNVKVQIENLGDFAREQALGLFKDNIFINDAMCDDLISTPEDWSVYHYFPGGELHEMIMRNLRLIKANYREFYRAEELACDPKNFGKLQNNITHRGNKLIAYDADDYFTQYVDVFGNLWEGAAGSLAIKKVGTRDLTKINNYDVLRAIK